MKYTLTIDEIRSVLDDCEEKGQYADGISGIASLSEAIEGDLSFLGNSRYKKDVEGCSASVLFLPKGSSVEPKEGQLIFLVKNPSYALALVCGLLEKKHYPQPKAGIHSTAVIEEGAEVSTSAFIGAYTVVSEGSVVGENVAIGSHCYLGRHTKVGEGSVIMSRVTVLDYCEIGKRARINPGVVLGSDGYGFESTAAGHERIPHVGRVVVGDNVDIGANTTIDRARFGITKIGAGTKIDNLVQVAHNVQVGEHCLLVSQSGISGSSHLDDNVIVGGQAGIAGHLTIGKGSMIGGQSGVSRNLPEQAYVRGTPAMPFFKAQKVEVLQRKLPDFFKRLKDLEER